MKDTVFYTKKTYNLNGQLFDLSTPVVMGILNVTPDSFYDKGQFEKSGEMLLHVEKMLHDGVDIIDVGGYSSRPGAEVVSENEELRRVREALQKITREFPDTVLSIDTFRSVVAKMAIEEGASIINDISGGEADHMMFQTIASLRVPYILMHMRGTPANMQEKTDYNNLLEDILDYFQKKLNKLNVLGVKDIILDPGFGFAKTIDQNYELLKKLKYFKLLNLPLLVGLSRKSMIYKKLGITSDEALNGTSALHMMALTNGTSILRAHDVKEAKQVIKLYREVMK